MGKVNSKKSFKFSLTVKFLVTNMFNRITCYNIYSWGLIYCQKPNPTYQTEPTKPNLPNPTYQTQPTKPDLPNPTYQTQPTKPNLPNQTYQTKPTNPNLPNHTYKTKPTNQTNHTKLTKPIHCNFIKAKPKLIWSLTSKTQSCILYYYRINKFREVLLAFLF